MSSSARTLLLLLAAGCGGTPPLSEHPVHDDAREPAATASGPSAQLAFVEVREGPLPEAEARAALGPMRPRVQACLAASSIRVEGHVVVRLEVGPGGDVTRSGTDHVDGLDPELVFCVVRAMRGGRLPRAEGPSVVRVGLDFEDPRAVPETAQPEAVLADEPIAPAAEPAPEESTETLSEEDATSP